MKLGLFNLMTMRERGETALEIVRDTADMVRLADDMGFDVAWFAEHHFSNYCICPSPLMMAAYFAPITKRIRLGTAVIVAPLYNPVRVTEEIALLDNLSEGRAVIGLGSGYQRYEFERFGLDLDDKIERMLEVWDIVEQGLTTGRVSYRGKHFALPETPITVRPVQKPMPEVFVTGTNPATVRRVARGGHTPFVSVGWRGLEALEACRARVAESFRAEGKDPDQMPLAIQRYIYVTDDRDDALEVTERIRYLGRVVAALMSDTQELDGPYLVDRPFPDEPSLEVLLEGALVGDPHKIAERMAAEIRALRVTHYSCFMCLPGLDAGRAMRSMERFGAEVLPLVERELGSLGALHEGGAERLSA